MSSTFRLFGLFALDSHKPVVAGASAKAAPSAGPPSVTRDGPGNRGARIPGPKNPSHASPQRWSFFFGGWGGGDFLHELGSFVCCGFSLGGKLEQFFFSFSLPLLLKVGDGRALWEEMMGQPKQTYSPVKGSHKPKDR